MSTVKGFAPLRFCRLAVTTEGRDDNDKERTVVFALPLFLSCNEFLCDCNNIPSRLPWRTAVRRNNAYSLFRSAAFLRIPSWVDFRIGTTEKNDQNTTNICRLLLRIMSVNMYVRKCIIVLKLMCYIVVMVRDMAEERWWSATNIKHGKCVLPVCNSLNICTAVSYDRVCCIFLPIFLRVNIKVTNFLRNINNSGKRTGSKCNSLLAWQYI